jgi:hypothetical protein
MGKSSYNELLMLELKQLYPNDPVPENINLLFDQGMAWDQGQADKFLSNSGNLLLFA